MCDLRFMQTFMQRSQQKIHNIATAVRTHTTLSWLRPTTIYKADSLCMMLFVCLLLVLLRSHETIRCCQKYWTP